MFFLTGHNYLWIAFVSLVWTNVRHKWAADNLQAILFQAWGIFSLKNRSVLGFCVFCWFDDIEKLFHDNS